MVLAASLYELDSQLHSPAKSRKNVCLAWVKVDKSPETKRMHGSLIAIHNLSFSLHPSTSRAKDAVLLRDIVPSKKTDPHVHRAMFYPHA